MLNITQTLPKSQKEIVLKSLRERQRQLQALISDFKGRTMPEDLHHELFDIQTLIAMFKYDVNVSMSKVENDNFTAQNGIDYPNYE